MTSAEMRPRADTVNPLAAAHSRIGPVSARGAVEATLNALRSTSTLPALGARRGDVRSEDAAQLLGIVVAEVDLQGHAVKRERDRLVGLGAVQVVDEPNRCDLCHVPLLVDPPGMHPILHGEREERSEGSDRRNRTPSH